MDILAHENIDMLVKVHFHLSLWEQYVDTDVLYVYSDMHKLQFSLSTRHGDARNNIATI